MGHHPKHFKSHFNKHKLNRPQKHFASKSQKKAIDLGKLPHITWEGSTVVESYKTDQLAGLSTAGLPPNIQSLLKKSLPQTGNSSPSKKHKKSKNPFKHLGSVKKNTGKGIGKIGHFANSKFKSITAPLTSLAKSPTTLMIILGLGAFIVLKVAK